MNDRNGIIISDRSIAEDGMTWPRLVCLDSIDRSDGVMMMIDIEHG